MFDGPLMLRVNWPVVDTIHPQSNNSAMGVNIKATGEYKLNYSPDTFQAYKVVSISFTTNASTSVLTLVPQSRKKWNLFCPLVLVHFRV